MIGVLAAIAVVWIVLALLALAAASVRGMKIDRRQSWDLTRNPGHWHELERRRARQRNDLGASRVRTRDVAEASRPNRSQPRRRR